MLSTCQRIQNRIWCSRNWSVSSAIGFNSLGWWYTGRRLILPDKQLSYLFWFWQPTSLLWLEPCCIFNKLGPKESRAWAQPASLRWNRGRNTNARVGFTVYSVAWLKNHTGARMEWPKPRFCWHVDIKCRAEIDGKHFDMDAPALKLFREQCEGQLHSEVT